MMRLSLGVLGLFLCLALVSGADDGPIMTSYALNGPHAYDIHWVSNSAIAFLLTNDGLGIHKLYRSTDNGMHWADQTQSLSNPSGQCYVVRIYADPQNPRSLIFMGPPEVNCGWISTDGGNTYKYVTIPGLQYLSFNPNITNLAIGRTADDKIYLTQDGGNSWSRVNATRASWAPKPVVPDTASYGNLYLVKDNVLGYSLDKGASFIPLFDSIVDLHATSNFVYALAQNRSLVVGQDVGNIQRAYFPFGETVPNVYAVSDDSSGATWFYTDSSWYWGNIYTASGTSGALYVEVRQHVLKRDDATLDIHSVHGLPGVKLANVVLNFNDYHDLQLKTYITYNNGGDWATLPAPSDQASCVGCTLNLYFNYKTNQRAFYTSSHTIGLILANGYVASSMSYDNPNGLNTFLSRDAGLHWEQLSLTPKGPYIFEFGQNGGILVLAPENQMTTKIFYSFDEGLTINTFTLPSSVYVNRIIGQSSNSVFILFAVNAQGSGIVYSLDFSNFQFRQCNSADYENWAPSDGTTQGCWLGQQVQYSRRSRSAKCNDTRGEMIVSAQLCDCTIEDYECDFGFAPAGATCVVAGELPPDPPAVCRGSYERSQGFRLVPGDVCSGGVDLRPKLVPCPDPPKTSGSSSKGWVAAVVIIVVLVVVGLLAFIVYRDPALKERVMNLVRPGRGSRYGRVGGNRARSSSLAHEEDFGIHDDLLEEDEEDAKVLHDNDISRASASNKRENEDEEFSIHS